MKKSILFSLLLVSQLAQADLWMYPPNDNNINGRNDASLRYDILGDQAQLSIKVEGRVAKKLMELSQREGVFSDYKCDANMGYCSKAIGNELIVKDYEGDDIGFAEDNTHLSLYKDAVILFYEGDIAKKVFDLSTNSGSELLETEFDNKKFTYTRINDSLVCVEQYNNIAINLFYSDYSYRCMELHRVDGETEAYEPSRLTQSIFRSFEIEYQMRIMNKKFL